MIEIGVMAQPSSKCPIWGTPAAVADGNGDFVRVDSDRAGGCYRVTRSAVPSLSPLDVATKKKLTTWLVDQRRRGEECPMIKTHAIDRIREQRLLSVETRLDRALLLLEYLGDTLSSSFRIAGAMDDEVYRTRRLLAAWTESQDEREAVEVIHMLAGEQLLQDRAPTYQLSLKGWKRLEQLRTRYLPTSQAFVAMWFSELLADVYHNGFEPAIKDCGFEPLRIDRKEHVNKIDDEIIAEIRRSRFLVADFTSERDRPRGGVYFEAGFAVGLNIPVIWTCRVDLNDQVHFDTRQFNHIAWEDAGDLHSKLKNRIAAVIGYGPGAN